MLMHGAPESVYLQKFAGIRVCRYTLWESTCRSIAKLVNKAEQTDKGFMRGKVSCFRLYGRSESSARTARVVERITRGAGGCEIGLCVPFAQRVMLDCLFASLFRSMSNMCAAKD